MGWGVPAGGHNCPGRGCHWGAMSHTAPGTPPAGNSPTSGETVRSEPGYSAQPRQDTITLLCSHSAGDRPAQHKGTRTSRVQPGERTGHSSPGWPCPPTQKSLRSPPQTSRVALGKSLSLCDPWHSVGRAVPQPGDGRGWKGSVGSTEGKDQLERPTHK